MQTRHSFKCIHCFRPFVTLTSSHKLNPAAFPYSIGAVTSVGTRAIASSTWRKFSCLQWVLQNYIHQLWVKVMSSPMESRVAQLSFLENRDGPPSRDCQAFPHTSTYPNFQALEGIFSWPSPHDPNLQSKITSFFLDNSLRFIGIFLRHHDDRHVSIANALEEDGEAQTTIPEGIWSCVGTNGSN